MISQTPPIRLLRASAVLGIAVAITPLHVQAGSELEQRLRYQYDNKILVLRDFYHGERLSYDSADSPVSGSAVSGDWTVDGFVRVVALSLSAQRLTIQAERLSVAKTGQSLQLQSYGDKKKKKKKPKKENRLDIEIAVDSGGITADKADAALSRIFLTSRDRFADHVPEYWKPCVLAASTGKGGKKYPECIFATEFAAIPGVVSNLDQSPEPEGEGDGDAKAPVVPVRKMEKGVKPPKVIFQKDPSFSEQARRAKYQGTVVLLLTVDKAGQVRNLRILDPLGFGLDQKAVESVSTWRFNPGTKDGEPVDMEIAIEVDFHLY